jgi:hypothetical protein
VRLSAREDQLVNRQILTKPIPDGGRTQSAPVNDGAGSQEAGGQKDRGNYADKNQQPEDAGKRKAEGNYLA